MGNTMSAVETHRPRNQRPPWSSQWATTATGKQQQESLRMRTTLTNVMVDVDKGNSSNDDDDCGNSHATKKTRTTTTSSTTYAPPPPTRQKKGASAEFSFLGSTGLPITPLINDIALSQLVQALNVIPDNQKVAYTTIKLRNPCLIEHHECHPLKFLRCEQYNPWTSARRLVSYWEAKCRIFVDASTSTGTGTTLDAQRSLGTSSSTSTSASIADMTSNRYSLPVLVLAQQMKSLSSRGFGGGSSSSSSNRMDSRMECALSESDMNLLRSGSAMRLTKDSDGRSVIILDIVTMLSTFVNGKDGEEGTASGNNSNEGSSDKATASSFLRCLFHALALCGENDSSQEDGIIVLLLVKDHHDEDSDADSCLGKESDYHDQKQQPKFPRDSSSLPQHESPVATSFAKLEEQLHGGSGGESLALVMKELVYHAMPLRVHSVHAACIASSPKSNSRRNSPATSSTSSSEAAFCTTESLVFKDGFVVNCTSHYCSTKEDLIHEVGPLGVTDALLPTRMGGKPIGKGGCTGLEDLYDDLAKKRQHEEANAATTATISALLLPPLEASPVSGAMNRGRGKIKKAKGLTMPIPSLTETIRGETPPNKKPALSKDANETLKLKATTTYEAAQEAKSDMDSPTSLRKRKKLTDDSVGMDSESAGNNSDTASSLTGPTASMPSGDDEASRLEFIRKRNALYSRRKYHRKKIEIEVLQNQSTDLKQQNQELKEEGIRLEKLIQEAKDCVSKHPASSAASASVHDHQHQQNLTTEVSPYGKIGVENLMLQQQSRNALDASRHTFNVIDRQPYNQKKLADSPSAMFPQGVMPSTLQQQLSDSVLAPRLRDPMNQQQPSQSLTGKEHSAPRRLSSGSGSGGGTLPPQADRHSFEFSTLQERGFDRNMLSNIPNVSGGSAGIGSLQMPLPLTYLAGNHYLLSQSNMARSGNQSMMLDNSSIADFLGNTSAMNRPGLSQVSSNASSAGGYNITAASTQASLSHSPQTQRLLQQQAELGHLLGQRTQQQQGTVSSSFLDLLRRQGNPGPRGTGGAGGQPGFR